MSGRKNLSLAQRAKIAEIRKRYKGTGMSKSTDEIIDIAKMSFPKIFPKNFSQGGAVSRGCGAAVSGKRFSGVR